MEGTTDSGIAERTITVIEGNTGFIYHSKVNINHSNPSAGLHGCQFQQEQMWGIRVTLPSVAN